MAKKILFLIGNLNNSGGTERVCSIIANGLSDNGYQVVITSISQGTQPFFPINNNIKVNNLFDTVGRALYRTPSIIYKLRRVLIAEKIDILIIVESMSVLFSLPAIQGLSIKHICWEHFNFKIDLGKSSRRLARQLAAYYCDIVVTLTDRDRNFWLANTNNKSQIVTIANPCPFIEEKSFSEKNTKMVLAVGRLTYQKGFDLLLDSWRKVNKDFPDWKLIIAGEGEDRSLLEDYLSKHDLSDSVYFVGNTNHIDQYYEKAEIFCLSSRFEGFPMVLLETLSYGIPVVAFDCNTGPAEILENTGSILVPDGNTSLLSEGLIKLIKDKKLRDEISIRSINKSKLYQSDLIIQNWLDLIEELDYKY